MNRPAFFVKKDTSFYNASYWFPNIFAMIKVSIFKLGAQGNQLDGKYF